MTSIWIFLALAEFPDMPVSCSARLRAEGAVFCGLSNTETQEQREAGAAPKLESSSEARMVGEQIHLHPDTPISSNSVRTMQKSVLPPAEAFSVSTLEFLRLFAEGLQHRKAQAGTPHASALCRTKAVRLHPAQANQRPSSVPLHPRHTDKWQRMRYYLPPPAEPYKCHQRDV